MISQTALQTYGKEEFLQLKVFDDNRMEGGLLPIFVHPDRGNFMGTEIRLGSRGDSYYGLYKYA